MEKCLLCDYVKCGGGNTFQCGPRGIETIIKSSDIRKDGAGELFKGKTSVELHVQCRKVYTRRPNKTPTATELEKVTRSSAMDFDFKLHCFFCDRLVDVQHPDRMPFCQVGTLEIIRSIREYAVKRNDQWGEQVTTKLGTVSDLVAVEGRYHRECYNYFKRIGSSLPGSSSVQGKKADSVKSAAFDKLCQELEEDCDDCQYTLAELILKMKQYDPTHDTYSEKHLKRKLKDKFGEGVVLTEGRGRISVVCFTGIAHKILSENWYSNRNADTQSERLRIIQTAARLLRQDILSKSYDTSHYPSASDMSGGGHDLVPDSLQLFLATLLQTKTKKAHESRQRKIVAIGQVIVSALRPRSFLSPLLFGLGVTLHRLFGSKLLIDMLHKLGFCSSYNEAGKPPTDWGFEKDEEGHLRPVTNRNKPAPDRLLEMVSCNCTQGCETRNCSCRRHKVVCLNICGYCAGHGCSNTLREEDEDNDDDPDGDLEPIPCADTDMELSSAGDFC